MGRLLLIGCLLVTVSGCDFVLFTRAIPGSGVAATQVREVLDFHAVEFQGGGSMDIVVADGTSCEISCDDNLLEFIVTEVKNGTLKIYNSEKISPRAGLTVTLQSKQLDAVTMAGSCTANVRQLDTESMALEIAGSGKVVLDGQSRDLDIEIAGSGEVNSLDLISQDVKISIAGSGDVKVHAGHTLDVSIAGSGKVRYRGDASVTRSVAGSGSVKPLPPETAGRET